MGKSGERNCPAASVEQLLDYSARRLDAETTIRLDRHVSQCPSCREFLASQQLVWDALDALAPATPRISASFDRELYARIANEQQESWWRRGWRRLFEAGQPLGWKPVLPLAAAACAVLFTVAVTRPPQHKPAPVATIAFEKQDIENIERALEDFEMLHSLGAPEATAAGNTAGSTIQ